jgi:hypothetical protein
VFVVWLQHALLGVGLAAFVKVSVVFGGTLLLSWGTIAAIRRSPPAAQVIGVGRARGVEASWPVRTPGQVSLGSEILKLGHYRIFDHSENIF